MSKKFKIILAAVFLISIFFSLHYAYAADPILPKECTAPGGCATLDQLELLIISVSKYIFGISGALALGVIIYGGVRILISAGNDAWVKAGKDAIAGGIIGLIIVLCAQLIVIFSINTLTKGGYIPPQQEQKIVEATPTETPAAAATSAAAPAAAPVTPPATTPATENPPAPPAPPPAETPPAPVVPSSPSKPTPTPAEIAAAIAKGQPPKDQYMVISRDIPAGKILNEIYDPSTNTFTTETANKYKFLAQPNTGPTTLKATGVTVMHDGVSYTEFTVVVDDKTYIKQRLNNDNIKLIKTSEVNKYTKPADAPAVPTVRSKK